MKTMNELEIDKIVNSLGKHSGWELQKVLFDEKALQMRFFSNGEEVWFVFSMKPGVPYLFYSTERIFLIKSLKKPLGLFLNTHFVGETFRSVERIKKLGRVVEFKFSGDKSIRLSLITGRVNVSAQVGSKSVHASKPKEISEKNQDSSLSLDEEKLRDNLFFIKHWQELKKGTPKNSVKDLSKTIKKKKIGLEKMEEKLNELQKDIWKVTGSWLKENQTIENIPEELTKYVDFKESLSWNIENCFNLSKKNKSKVEGTLERVNQLKKEIEGLEKGEIKVKPPQSKQKNLLKEANLKGKTVELSCGRMFIGKSGAENLKLLRKAKPWYLWLHIKDYPGAYGIIEVSKKKANIDRESLETAAKAVVRQSLPQGQGGSFEVIYCECRYVRPIKGAKSGQVTYSHETVLSVKV